MATSAWFTYISKHQSIFPISHRFFFHETSQTNGSLMKVQSIAEGSPWSILQYFWPALSDDWSWKPTFGLFESGRFTQVLL